MLGDPVSVSVPIPPPLNTKVSTTPTAPPPPLSPISSANDSSYTRNTTIETWLTDIKLEDYIPYFRNIGVKMLKDMLPYCKINLTKDDLLREWEELDFENQISLIHQIKIAKEMRKLTSLS